MGQTMGFDFEQQHKKIKTAALTAIKSTFPIDGIRHRLELERVWVEESLGVYDISEQKKTKFSNGSWAEPIYASLKLIDKESGKTVDTLKKFKLFNLPKQTSRFSYIIDGNEYQPINQLRLKSGVYSRIKANNQLESQFNLARGMNFKILLNQETGLFYINISTSNIKLLPILVDLGMDPASIRYAWGDDLFETNLKASRGVMTTEIFKLHNKLTRKDTTSREEAIAEVHTYFDDRTELSKEVTKLNIGKAYGKVNANLLLDVSKRLLGIAKKTEEPDDRDSLISKEIHSIEDFIGERLVKNAENISKAIKRNIDKKFKIREIISLDTFNQPIKTLFTSTSLASTTEQINPLDMISNQWKVTIMGEGGITNIQQISNMARAVHPTHLGFVDPFQTVEGENIGASLQLSLASAKVGKELKTFVYDLKIPGDGSPKQISPKEFFDNYVAFPDEYILKNGKRVPQNKDKITAMHKGSIAEVSPSKIKFVIASEKGILGMPTNLIPFVNSNNGNRVMMAAKMLPQALSLKSREEPLVQTSMGKDETFHSGIAKHFDTPSEVSGIVESINPSEIMIKDKTGNLWSHQIYDNFPLNQKSFMHDNAIVSVGQKVKKGQRLTENNYTKDGKLALGINLKAAYIPMKGYSFEDSIVISESTSRKLTSEHMYKKSVRIAANTVISLKKFQAHYPGVVTNEMSQKLDSLGVIKKGQKVSKGDIIIAALVESEVSKEDSILAKISRSLVKPYKDKSVVWEYDFPAVVTDVIKTKKRIDVYIKSEEQAVIGDKLSGVHGNKGTIGLILPDNEMPHNRAGDPVDLLLNPHGLVSRMNPGQMLETVAAKIAEKLKKIYVVDNFEDKNYYKKVMDDAETIGVKGTEKLFDPVTGVKLGDIFAGKQYILKLNHPTRKKFSARSYGEGYSAELAPSRGGSTSGQSIDPLTVNSLLAHGSRNILRETHSIKSEKNDEYWRALQMGLPLPPPKNTFIYDKFVGYLKGTGIDVVKNGNRLQLLPLTDKDILANSNGEIKSIAIVRGKNLREEPNGLFDPKITGGLQGLHAAHMRLSEPVPNPVFENAIKAVTGLKKEQYEGIVNGVLFVDKSGVITDDYTKGSTGGLAINQMLGKIKVAKRIKELNKIIPKAKKAELNKLNKELRYLTSLVRMDRKPTDYVLKNIPVVPPIFRPIYTLPDGNTTVSDLNRLYKDVKSESDQLKDSLIPEYDKKNLRTDLYKSVKALFGLGQSLTKPDLKGTLAEIRGDKPKTGLFQSKLIKRRQDLSGRSVITPGPNLGVDECGIPEPMAWKLYKPFVVKRLVQSGYTPLQAQVKIEEKDDIAKSALITEMEERHVMLNRAPSLHKFSIMGFKPKLIDGKAIRLPNLVCKGYGADFDGDKILTIIMTSIDEKNSNSIIENNYCSRNYLEERKMSAKFKTTVPGVKNDEEIYIFDLEDFPHGKFIKTNETKAGPIHFYEMPFDVKVLSYDERTKQLEWARVEQYTVHPDSEIEIVTLKSKRQIITDDDPRAIYGINSGTLEFTTNTPEIAVAMKMLVPRAARLENLELRTDHNLKTIKFENITLATNAHCVKGEVELTKNLGYLIGAICGDGWTDNALHLSGITREIVNKVDNCVAELFDGSYPNMGSIDLKTSYGESRRSTWHSKNLSHNIAPLVGSGAGNKHLPAWFIKAPLEFKKGLLAGLMDTDGGVGICHPKAKPNPQLMVNYYSVSLRLIREVKILAEGLGVRGRITATKTPAGRPAWLLYFSNYDFKNKYKGLGMMHPEKLRKLALIEIKPTPALMRHDIVPISSDLARHMYQKIGSPRAADIRQRTAYEGIYPGKKRGYVTRYSAIRAIKYLSVGYILEHDDGAVWIDMVNNEDITWDQVMSFERTGIKETGYDLSVPGFETFTNIDGLVLHNTMAVHVPVTEEGKREAKLMMPSNHLLNPGSRGLMLAPSQESLIGLYLLTKKGKKTNKKYKNLIEARNAVKKKQILATDQVTINGVKTTTGRYIVNEILPEDLRNYNIQIDKRSITKILKAVVAKHENNYNTIVDAMQKLGNDHAYYAGFTVSMADLKPIAAKRDHILKSADKAIAHFKSTKNPSKTQLDKKSVEIYTKATNEMKKALEDALREKENALYQMATSGARGNLGQVRQIVMAPMLLVNTDGKVIPRPVRKSYVEGLSTAEMWIQSYGSRKGAIDKSRETSGPGELSKMLVSSAMNNVISVDDCGTRDGIMMDVNDKDIFDRYASKDVAGVVKYNDIVTPSVVEKAKRKKITQLLVRSPLRCEALEGTCSLCSGLDESGDKYNIGTNIGVIAAQTLSEPATQLIMKSFHTGGAAGEGSKIIGAFDRLKQLTNMPQNLVNKATLSSVTGKVSDIKESSVGGFDVFVGNTKHHVRAGYDLKIKAGDQVRMGDKLSSGVVKPQELLEYKGMDSVQTYLKDELYDLYKDDGPVRKSIIEQMIRSITSLTRIDDPLDTNYIAGDIVPIRKIEALNKSADKNHKILHTPILKGINMLPTAMSSYEDADWAGRMGYTHLLKTMSEGASQGWSTDIHGYHPIPGLMYAAEFGESEKGKY